jgi:hypothetical protein
MALAMYTGVAVMGFLMSRVMKIRFLSVWAFKDVGSVLAVALVCGLAAYLCCAAIPADTYAFLAIRLAVGAVVYGVIYIGLTSWIGLFNWREWRRALRPSREGTGTDQGLATGGLEAEPPQPRDC